VSTQLNKRIVYEPWLAVSRFKRWRQMSSLFGSCHSGSCHVRSRPARRCTYTWLPAAALAAAFIAHRIPDQVILSIADTAPPHTVDDHHQGAFYGEILPRLGLADPQQSPISMACSGGRTNIHSTIACAWCFAMLLRAAGGQPEGRARGSLC